MSSSFTDVSVITQRLIIWTGYIIANMLQHEARYKLLVTFSQIQCLCLTEWLRNQKVKGQM